MLPYLKQHTVEEKRPGRVASGRLVPDTGSLKLLSGQTSYN